MTNQTWLGPASTPILAAVFASFLSGASGAATYTSGALAFSSSDQSVWGPGGALVLSGSEFVGLSLNGSLESGEISGSRNTNTTYIGYDIAKGAWDVCIALPTPNSWCGSAPRRSDYAITITTDTRNGYNLDLTTQGRVGFEFNYDLNAGSMDAHVGFVADAILPEVETIKKGEAFLLDTSSTLQSGALSSEAPTFDLSLDAVLEALVKGSVTGCVWGLGCRSGSETILNVDVDKEVLGITPTEIRYLDGFVPASFDNTAPFGKVTASFEAGINAGVPVAKITLTDKDGKKTELKPTVDVGLYVDLGEASIEIPQYSATGGLDGSSLKLSAQADFIDLLLDVDTFAGLPGGATVSLGALGLEAKLEVDAYNIKAGPSLDVFQDLVLTPELMVSFDFSKPVEIAGQLVSTFTGAWKSLPAFKIFEETVFTPTYFISALVSSKTGLQIGLEAVIEMLKAQFTLSAFGFDIADIGLGPVYSKNLAYNPSFGKFSIFDNSFYMGGFNTVQGASFTLAPYTSPAPVPVPPALLLLGCALGGLGLMRRGRRVAA